MGIKIINDIINKYLFILILLFIKTKKLEIKKIKMNIHLKHKGNTKVPICNALSSFKLHNGLIEKKDKRYSILSHNKNIINPIKINSNNIPNKIYNLYFFIYKLKSTICTNHSENANNINNY